MFLTSGVYDNEIANDWMTSDREVASTLDEFVTSWHIDDGMSTGMFISWVTKYDHTIHNDMIIYMKYNYHFCLCFRCSRKQALSCEAKSKYYF